MNKENCALKLVDEIILYYDARSKNIKFYSVRQTIYDIFNCNWVATHWQQYSTHFTHKQYIEQHNRHKQYTEQHNSLIWKSVDRVPSLRGIPWHLPYNRGKSTEKPQSG